MTPVAITFVILGAAIIGFMTNRLPLVVVAIAVPISLWATGLLSIGEAFAASATLSSFLSPPSTSLLKRSSPPE